MTDTPPASVLDFGQVETDLVPGPVEYAVLTPPNPMAISGNSISLTQANCERCRERYQ